MRRSVLAITACAALAVSGCSQISGWVKGDRNASSQQANANLRNTPGQSYQFSDGDYDVELYETGARQGGYAGYDVVLFDNAKTQLASSLRVDPRDAAFVKLNGTSDNTDWRNCETRSKGYLFISEYDFSLQPEFEVCMRNKGYVLATEAGAYATNPISAQTAGLRGYSQPAMSQPGLSQPTYGYPTQPNYGFP